MVLAKSRLVAMAPRYGSRTQKLHDIQDVERRRERDEAAAAREQRERKEQG
jgi:hypothetical protein